MLQCNIKIINILAEKTRVIMCESVKKFFRAWFRCIVAAQMAKAELVAQGRRFI